VIPKHILDIVSDFGLPHQNRYQMIPKQFMLQFELLPKILKGKR